MTTNGKFIRTRAFRGFLTVLRVLQNRHEAVYHARMTWDEWYNANLYKIQDEYEKGNTPQEAFANIGAEA